MMFWEVVLIIFSFVAAVYYLYRKSVVFRGVPAVVQAVVLRMLEPLACRKSQVDAVTLWMEKIISILKVLKNVPEC